MTILMWALLVTLVVLFASWVASYFLLTKVADMTSKLGED